VRAKEGRCCARKKASDEVLDHHYKTLDGLKAQGIVAWRGPGRPCRTVADAADRARRPFKHQPTLPA